MIGRLLQRPFRAMGTSCAAGVTVRGGWDPRAERALAAAKAEVAACEHALSRFDATSDLSRLNRAAGGWVDVDPRLLDALAAALRAREDTGGRFDPTILPALVAAGYDRTFDELDERPARPADGFRAGAEVHLDPARGRARVAAGAAVDLGGIGKGFSAGRALAAMQWAWPSLAGGLVDLGGDVALAGETPEGGPWRVAIADPRSPGSELGTLALEDGGVATSGRDRRRFGPGRSLHHLIDPATGAPAVAGPLSVTVVAPDPAEAEAHATALAVSGLDDARSHLRRFPHLAALYVPEDGEPVAIGDLPLLAAAGAVA
jgi:FAD:protein FMN transferase